MVSQEGLVINTCLLFRSDLKYQKRILQHIVYIKQNFAGHERYQWHTLEQLQMENYFKK